jgi:hypothetical protein
VRFEHCGPRRTCIHSTIARTATAECEVRHSGPAVSCSTPPGKALRFCAASDSLFG